MKLFHSKKQGVEPLYNRSVLLLVCLAVVAVLMLAWELAEHLFFAHVDPRVMHWLYMGRSAVGALVTTLVAFKVVLSSWEKAQREILKRDRFLASVVDSSGEAIVVLDPQGEILFWNKSAEGMLGYSSQEAVGMHFQFLFPNDAKDGEAFADFMRAIQQKDTMHNYEVEQITKAGKRLLTSLTVTQVRDVEGNSLGISVLMHDITQRRVLEEKLAQSDRVGTIGQLAASIAHEIGTPLNVISGNAEYLLGDKESRRSPGKELQIIVDETERISKLIKRLMHITQPQTLDMREVQVNDIVRRVLDFVVHEMEKAGVVLESHLDEKLPLILGDADQLEQVLLNVVMNAIQAMPTGGRLFVSTSVWHVELGKPPLVQMRVSDTGSGIAKEVMPKIFDPFFTTKKAVGSSGLGLSISYRIIEDHKGTVKIDSILNKGTSVTIRLPSIEFGGHTP